jgi:hypothetical protein
MGNTHWRSDLRETGAARTASFSTIAAATVTTSGAITGGTTITGGGLVTGTGGLYAPTGKYVRIGSIYIVSSAAVSAFTKAAIDALATGAIGVTLATSIPRGSIFINASSNTNSSQCLYVRSMTASWVLVSNGSIV